MSVAAPASLGEIQQALGPREAILEYTIPYNEADPAPGIWMLLIAHDRFVPARAPMEKVKVENCMLRNRIIVAGTPLDGSPLGCTVINLRIGIQRGDDDYAKQSLAALYRLLIEPLLAKGVRIEDFDRLIVVPHGPLHYVPFAALRDETGNYLVSKTAVTVAPSASVWRLLAARQGEARRLMSFSNPTLQHGAEEVGKVMASARAAGLTASPLSEAAKSRFLEAMTPANILHLATHGAAPDEDADDNQPLFLDGDGKTPVRASEIRSLQLTANRLTVLSVCDAGLYRTGPGNEPYGLMPAFLQAGSQNVLATLWPLDDLFGREFMTEFYSHLWSDGPAGAMRQTAIHFIDNRQPIRNWAAFVLMGPGRAFETSESR